MSKMKVIWALDPFETSTAVYDAAINTLKKLRERGPIEILPVAVLSSDGLTTPVEFNIPQVTPYRKKAQAALRRVIRHANLPGVVSPSIITEGFLTRFESIGALINTATKHRADLILLNTHGRKGLKRLVVGSFAESLLLQSPIPVLVVGPGVKRQRHFDQILFPTDFGAGANAVFQNVVGLARRLGSRLTIYHAIHSPEGSIQTWGVHVAGNYVPLKDYLAEQLARRQRKARSWVAWANKQGVTTELLIETTTKRISDAVLRAADRKKAGFVAMEAQSGRLSAALIGSSTRDVVRQAPVPIYVLRPEKARNKRVTRTVA